MINLLNNLLKEEVLYYFELLDYANKGTLVVETVNGHFKVFVTDNQEVFVEKFSMVPYYMLDTDEYDLFRELTEEEFLEHLG